MITTYILNRLGSFMLGLTPVEAVLTTLIVMPLTVGILFVAFCWIMAVIEKFQEIYDRWTARKERKAQREFSDL